MFLWTTFPIVLAYPTSVRTVRLISIFSKSASVLKVCLDFALLSNTNELSVWLNESFKIVYGLHQMRKHLPKDKIKLDSSFCQVDLINLHLILPFEKPTENLLVITG